MSGWSLGVERPDLLWWLLLLVPIWVLPWVSKRRLSRRRWAAVVAVRTALVLAVVLAVAETTLRRAVDDVAVVFVVDQSASMGAAARQQALDFVSAALAEQRADDQAALVVFGAEAMVEAELSDDLEVHRIEATPSPHHSDLAAGLRLGTALLPADRARRLVVLTDGEQTRGDAAAQALLTATDDLTVSAVDLSALRGAEVVLDDLLAPAQVDAGATYEVKVVARSDHDVQGTLRLYRNDTYLGSLPVQLTAGRAEVFPFRQEADDPGLYRFRAVIEVEGDSDARPENNQVVSTVAVRGRPRVLVVERDLPAARHLVTVLEGEGLQVDLVGADRLPADLAGLRPYAAVFLSDIAAYVTTRQQQEALRSYVRDLGRGLVMIGGDESFGVGGWYRSPVEEALPVRMDLEDKTRFPSLAMVLALDKSCSMGGGQQGTKLGLAKEAALQTADLLSERDSLGIVSFDGASTWISRLAPLADRQRVYDDVAAIRPGGGTVVYAAVEESMKALRASDAALKHVILLSDGIIGGRDPKALIQQGHADQITLTAIGIGTDADRQTIADYAAWGGGNHYIVTDKHSIPAIFTRETLLATRSFLVEEPFEATRGAPSELTRGLGPLPVLEGYVATEARERSTVALWVPDEEGDLPLLAHGRYGLGRSVAFTSDAKARWASAMLGTESYTRLWSQVARYVVADGAGEGLQVDARIEEGELVVSVDAVDEVGGFRNFLNGEARVVAPDLQTLPLELQQVGPGRYEARRVVDQDGSWLVGVELSDDRGPVGQAVAEAVQPYSPEYRVRAGGSALVAELGRVGGGGVLTDPASVFARPELARQVPKPLWPALMALAAVLLLLDVASRRLQWGSDPRARTVTQPSAAAARYRPRPTAPPTSRPVAVASEAPEALDEPVEVAPEVPADSYAGRLLAARKKARDKLDD
jgi:uncharacterized membrane protein